MQSLNELVCLNELVERHQNNVTLGTTNGSVQFTQSLRMLEYFKHVKMFVENVYNGSEEYISHGNAKLENGSYIRALADSFYDILASYLDLTPIDLGIEFSPVTDVSYQAISNISQLEDAKIVLVGINYMIDEIVKNNLNGCQILSTTMKYTQLGYPEDIEIVFRRIHCKVETALLQDIACWVVLGELNSNGLFIKERTPNRSDMYDTMSEVTMSEKKDNQCASYEIDASYLPVHMKYSLAQKILSIGQLLVILKEAPPDIGGTPDFEGGLFGLNRKELLDKFKSLEMKYSINLAGLQKIVDEISSLLDKRAVALCKDVGGLDFEMDVLAQVALLTRSDLASRFLNAVGEKLLAHPRHCGFKHMFTKEWERAAEDLGLDPSIYTSRFKLSLPSFKVASSQDCDTLSVLRLRYQVPWPLHFLIGDQEVMILAQAFTLLARVRLARLNASKAHIAVLRGECGDKHSLLAVSLHWLSVLAIELEAYFLSSSAGLSSTARNEIAAECSSIFALHQKFRIFVATLANSLFLPFQDTEKNSVKNDQGLSICINKEVVKLLGCIQLTCQAINTNNAPAAEECLKSCDIQFHALYKILNEASSLYSSDSSISLLNSIMPLYISRLMKDFWSRKELLPTFQRLIPLSSGIIRARK